MLCCDSFCVVKRGWMDGALGIVDVECDGVVFAFDSSMKRKCDRVSVRFGSVECCVNRL